MWERAKASRHAYSPLLHFLFHLVYYILMTFICILSFLVDACMKLLAHVDTEGLFRKSGSVIRLKALRVSDGCKLTLHSPKDLDPEKGLTQQFFVCVCPGKTGRGWGVPVHCTSLWRGRSGEAVLQGAARAGAAHRPAGGLSQGPAAPHRAG